MSTTFSNLSAVIINCSIKHDKTKSHTQRLADRVAGVMKEEGVSVEQIYALKHTIAFGMVENGADQGLDDDWPKIQKKVEAADILILAMPIWLGAKSSVASLVIERLYAYSAEVNQKGQYIYYGKVGGCIVTGNEDGVKHCGMETLYALQHIGYTIPPQADCGWIGEIGPGPSYGDDIDGSDVPAGYDNDFTNKNATFMAWNLMHLASILKKNDGIPANGNTAESWQHVSNAKDQLS